MKFTITLEEESLHEAIKDYVVKMGVSVDSKNIDINLIAGRKPNGSDSATIEISDIEDVLDVEQENSPPILKPLNLESPVLNTEESEDPFIEDDTDS